MKTQSQWLTQFVEFNMEKRTETEKNDDKDGKKLHKLMNDAVYGKTIENVRNRSVVKNCTKWKRLFEINIRSKLYVTKSYLMMI